MSSCDLSIVLPVHDDQENLNRILAELLANTPSENWEVIVVDDGSDSPLNIPSGLPENWMLNRYETQRGAAFARNQGVKQSSGTHILFLSVFLRIPPNYIDRISTFIEKNLFDVAQHLLVKAPELKTDHFQQYLANQGERIQTPELCLPVKNTQFAAALLKRETFLGVDGFDEKMNHYGGHELDLAYRLDQKGFTRRIIIQDLPLERIKLETLSKVRSRLQEYGRIGLPALLAKHPELKKIILPLPSIWLLMKLFMVPRLLEKSIEHKIEKNKKVSSAYYRLYLHLLVRNAWDAR